MGLSEGGPAPKPVKAEKAGRGRGKSAPKTEAADVIAEAKASGLSLVQPEDMSEGELAHCVSECVTSEKDYCECKCGGVNHGTGVVVAEGAEPFVRKDPIIIGIKTCACGCGQPTARRFVPGHDARFHSAEKRRLGAEAAGLSLEEYDVKVKAEKRAAINERNKAKRAAAASTDEAIAARAAKASAKIAKAAQVKIDTDAKRAAVEAAETAVPTEADVPSPEQTAEPEGDLVAAAIDATEF